MTIRNDTPNSKERAALLIEEETVIREALHASVEFAKMNGTPPEFIAADLDMGYSTLMNACNIDSQPDCHFQLKRVNGFMRRAGTVHVLKEIARLANHLVLPIPDRKGDKKEMANALIHVMREFGESVKAFEDGFKDEKVTTREKAKMLKETYEALTAQAEYWNLLKEIETND